MSVEFRPLGEITYLKALLRAYHLLILAQNVQVTYETIKDRFIPKDGKPSHSSLLHGSLTEYEIDKLPEIAQEMHVTTEKVINDNILLILTEAGDYPIFVSFANEPSLIIPVLHAITAIRPERESVRRAHGAIVIIPALLRESLPELPEEKAKRLIISSD